MLVVMSFGIGMVIWKLPSSVQVASVGNISVLAVAPAKIRYDAIEKNVFMVVGGWLTFERRRENGLSEKMD